MRSFFHGSEHDSVDPSESIRERRLPVLIGADTVAVGKPPQRLPLDRLGVRIDSICQGGICELRPDLHIPLQENDVIVLYGPPDHLEQAERWLTGKVRHHALINAVRRPLRRWWARFVKRRPRGRQEIEA